MSFTCPGRRPALRPRPCRRASASSRPTTPTWSTRCSKARRRSPRASSRRSNRIGDDHRGALERRRSDHAAGLQAGLASLRRGRLDGPCRRRKTHGGQGLPLGLSAALMEDLNGANLGFALCPMLQLRRDRGAGAAWQRRTEARLSAEDRQRRMAGDDEPDRAAGRQRRRRAQDPRRADRRRQLADQGHQDLHHLWRA